jgi:hypothetical protein
MAVYCQSPEIVETFSDNLASLLRNKCDLEAGFGQLAAGAAGYPCTAADFGDHMR